MNAYCPNCGTPVTFDDPTIATVQRNGNELQAFITDLRIEHVCEPTL